MKEFYELITINTDGGSRGNPGQAGIGVVAKSGEDEIFTISEKIGETTNNVAEYTAVYRALQKIEEINLKIEKLKFILDSELIVKQITGLYRVKQPHLQEIRSSIVDKIKVLRLNKNLNTITFSHVLREKNKEADKLVNLALDS